MSEQPTEQTNYQKLIELLYEAHSASKEVDDFDVGDTNRLEFESLVSTQDARLIDLVKFVRCLSPQAVIDMFKKSI